jgi:tRNA A-37 threonylcarbamoyl transferase component Bud32
MKEIFYIIFFVNLIFINNSYVYLDPGMGSHHRQVQKKTVKIDVMKKPLAIVVSGLLWGNKSFPNIKII